MQNPDPRETAASRRASVARDGGASAAWSVGLGLVGLVTGAALAGSTWGALSGLTLGLLVAAWHTASRRAAAVAGALEEIEWRIADLERPRSARAERAPEPAAGPRPESPPLAARPEIPAEQTPEPAPPEAREAPAVPKPPPTSATEGSRPPTPAQPGAPDFVAGAVAFLRELLLGVNTVAWVGIGVLLVGVALLAKWAADHALFPIEARLASAAAIGAALTALGYRLREARPGFATTLQGGGIAALYLVVFAAFRLFGLVPAGMAFAFFIAIAGAGGLLAVLQRSQPLIVIGSLGGFLAPIAASTGSGNHVVLFSYYLLLNVAVAAVAWFRAWRPLKLLAFVCTYGVATTWGVLRYRAEDFASTEPFLLAFLVLFTAEAVLFAWRRPPRLRGVVDGTLVFGTPLVTLLAQARLVQGIEFGLAYSAVGFGLFYAALATWLWRRAPDMLRRLTEAFLAVAVGFGTMAIPLAFEDAINTAIAWSLEGAGIYWVGSRQGRLLARLSGIGLQVLAVLALAAGSHSRVSADAIAIANGPFLSCLALAVAGFFIAREAASARSQLSHRERSLTQALGAWGLLWWATGTCGEIVRFVPAPYEAACIVTLIGASALALERGALLLDWASGRSLALASLAAAAIAVPAALDSQPHLLANGGALAWPFCLAAIYAVLGRLERDGPVWLRLVYPPAFWLLALVTAIALAGLADRGARLSGDWPVAAFGLGLAIITAAALLGRERGWGGFGRHRDLQLRWGLGPVVALALCWFGAANAAGSGDATPLPYVPLLNPVELALCSVGLASASWWLALQRERPGLSQGQTKKLAAAVLSGIAFLLLNGVLARSVHQWSDVPFRLDALWHSQSLQVSLSIAWTLVALAGMWLSTRRGWRAAWIASAILIAVVVVKLFCVDLSQLSTPAKIGTFLVVGALLLVVGYVSPVPPAASPGDPGPAGGERDGAPAAAIEAGRQI